MKFEFDQTIGAPLPGIMEAYCDPAFYEALGAMPELGHPLLLERHEEEQGGADARRPGARPAVRLKVRFAFAGEVSAAVRAVVDPGKLSWVSDMVVRPDAGTITFVVVPDHYPDRLEASGTDSFTAVGDGRSTLRATRGEVRVHVPLLGSRAERGIADGYRRHLASEASLLEEWLVA